MSFLQRHRANLQALAEVIRFSLGIEVFFVDEQRIAVAGTGPYRLNVGTRRPTDSYVDLTINEGEDQLVREPRYTKQCYRCEYRSLCPYSMVICRPVVQGEGIKGLMGFLAFSEQQRRVMSERSSFLQVLPQRLDYVWQTGDMNVEAFLEHAGTREFIDQFEEGLILTTPDFRLLNMNDKAQFALRRTGIKTPSGKAPVLDEVFRKVHVSDRKADRSPGEFSKGGRSGAYPISGGRSLGGHLIVLAGSDRELRQWSTCPFDAGAPSNLIGSSDALNSLKERAAYAAEGDSTVLLLGETGVGKEVVARYIHAMSPRWARPFEAVNCAAIPDPLFESELFGYAPGAFTGAKKTGKPGKFQIAQSGTIFLDEVGRLSLQNQAKILRILEEGEFQRLGDASKGHVDVRLLAATNISLEEAIEQDVFLKDLYFRLAVIPLRIPPLRERLEDIPSLIAHFVANLERVLPHANFFGFSDDAISFLMEYSWPGNVRQLRNAVEYAMNIVRGRQVQPDDLHTIIPGLNDTPVACAGAHTATASGLKAAETQCIRQALETFGHTTEGKRQAARHLGIGLSTLYRKLAAMRASACVENRPGDSGWMDDVGR